MDPLNNVLTIKARFLGTVSETGSIWNPGWKEEFNYNNVGILFLEVMQFLKKSPLFNAPNTRDQAFWRIPIGDTETNALGMTQRATDKSRRECKAMMDILFKKQSPGKMPTVVSYLSSIKDKHNAKPFISDCGHVGLCPHVSLRKDEIFVPVGSHVPIIFRRVTGGQSDWRSVYLWGGIGERFPRTPANMMPSLRRKYLASKIQ